MAWAPHMYRASEMNWIVLPTDSWLQTPIKKLCVFFDPRTTVLNSTARHIDSIPVFTLAILALLSTTPVGKEWCLFQEQKTLAHPPQKKPITGS